MTRKKRLLWQLFPSYLLITIVSLVAITWYASRSLRHFFLEQTALDLEARAILLENQILKYLDPIDKTNMDLLCKKIGKSASTRVTVILPSGRVIGDSESNPAVMDTHVDRPEFIQALNEDFGMSVRYSNTLGKNMMYLGIPVRKEGQILAVVRTSIPIDSIDDALKKIQNKIVLWGFAIGIFAAVLSLLVSRRIIRPIEQIKKRAESITNGDFQSKQPVDGSYEIQALSDAINRMTEELNNRIDTIMRQRNEIEAVLSSMIEGVIAVDKEERIISMNHAAAKMFSCDPIKAQSRSIHEVVRNTVLHQFVTEALDSAEPIRKDIVLYSDEEKILDAHGMILRDADGKHVGALIVLNDITQLLRLENIRHDFVANVSHEIKTPITAIKGFVETLRSGSVKDSKDIERFLEIIEKHVHRLESIIEDLLSLSRIERGTEREEISLQETRIKDVLLTAIQICEVKAAPKNIRIELSCNEDLVAKINPPLLEQAVVNLLDNSIKYSEEGSSIQVEAAQMNGEINISVNDKGCGIDKEHLPRLFERFYRVDKARSRQMGGTGLGLAIVKHIAQAHSGRVTVESTVGKGSTFSIRFPVNHAFRT